MEFTFIEYCLVKLTLKWSEEYHNKLLIYSIRFRFKLLTFYTMFLYKIAILKYVQTLLKLPNNLHMIFIMLYHDNPKQTLGRLLYFIANIIYCEKSKGEARKTAFIMQTKFYSIFNVI